MRLTALFTVCLLALPHSLSAQASKRAASAAETDVALLALHPLGTETEIAQSLEKFLRAEVARLRGVSLQSRAATLAKLEGSAENEQSCAGDVKCLAQLGGRLGVDKVLYGTVASLGDSYVLDLKLVDVARQKEQDRQSVPLSGSQEVMIDGVRAIATQLLAPEQFVGALELRLDKPGADIYIDGQPVGRTPLRRINDIKPGKHGLKIVLTGYQDFDRFVEIRFARITIVNVSLSGDTIDAVIEATPVEPLPVVMTEAPAQPAAPAASATPSKDSGASALLVAGVGATALGAGFVVGGLSLLGGMYLSMTEYTDDQGVVTEPVPYETLQKAYGWWPLGWAFAGVGATAVAAGLGMGVLGMIGGDEPPSADAADKS